MNNALMLELERAFEEGVNEVKGDFGPRNGKIFPSDLGLVVGDGGCKRAWWHQLRDAPSSESSIDGQLKMLTGDYLEEMVIDVFTRILPKHGYRVVETQKYAEVPETTGGKMDILIEDLETGDREVIEVKSTSAKSKNFLPKPGHVLQTQSYMRSEGATRGHVVYVFREMDDPLMAFKVNRDDEKVEEKARELRELAEGPEPPKTDKAWQRRYCRLKECKCK